jgi:hypothetical protein
LAREIRTTAASLELSFNPDASGERGRPRIHGGDRQLYASPRDQPDSSCPTDEVETCFRLLSTPAIVVIRDELVDRQRSSKRANLPAYSENSTSMPFWTSSGRVARRLR